MMMEMNCNPKYNCISASGAKSVKQIKWYIKIMIENSRKISIKNLLGSLCGFQQTNQMIQNSYISTKHTSQGATQSGRMVGIAIKRNLLKKNIGQKRTFLLFLFKLISLQRLSYLILYSNSSSLWWYFTMKIPVKIV